MKKWTSGFLMAMVAFVAVLGSPLTSSAATVQVSTVANPVAGGTVLVNGADWTTAQPATVGTQYTLGASESAGYVFAGWSIAGSAWIDDPTSSSTGFIFSADSVVTANFITAGTAVLTVAADPVSSGTVNPYVIGDNTVTLGWKTVTPSPASGYAFSSWAVTGDVTVFDPLNSDGRICVKGAGTLTATFVATTTATLTVALNPVSGGTVNRATGTYNIGEWYSIWATPAVGFKFQSWSITENGRIWDTYRQGDPGGNPNYTNYVYLLGDATLTANFVADTTTTATLTVVSNPTNGGTTNLATGIYNVGEWYSIWATPATGFKFQSWSITANGIVLDINDQGSNFLNNYVYLLGDATLTANFVPDTTTVAKLVVDATPLCGLDTFYIDGSSSFLGDHYLKVGQWYQIRATANPYDVDGNYIFVFNKWTTSGAVNLRIMNGDATSSPTYWILLTGDATLTANFTEAGTVDLTMAVLPADTGYVWPTIGTQKVPSNTWMPIQAYALPGYRFVSWSSSSPDVIILNNTDYYSYVFALAAGTVTANFEAATPAQMTVAINLPGAAYIEGYTGFADIYQPGTGTYAVNIGERNHLRATPASGYKFKQVTITGTATAYYDTSEYGTSRGVDVVLTGDATVTFEYEVSTLADFTVAVTPTGKAETYVAPGTYQFTVGQRYYVYVGQIYPGYQFVKWTATGGVVVDADHSDEYEAYFDFTAAGTLTLELVAVPMGTLTLSANPAYAPDGYYDTGFMIADATTTSLTLSDWEAVNPGEVKLYIGKSYLIKVYPTDAYKFTQWNPGATVEIKKVTEFNDLWERESGLNPPDWYYLTISGDGTLEAAFTARGSVSLGVAFNPAGSGLLISYSHNSSLDLAATNTLYAGLWYEVRALSTAGLYFQNINVTGGSVDVEYLISGYKAAKMASVISEGNNFYMRVNTNATIEALYAATPPTFATLTMAQISPSVGATTPVAGSYKVHTGEPYAVTATPAGAGHFFSRWEADTAANVVFGSRSEAATTVKLTGDATVTPIFTEYAPGSLVVASMSINVRNDNDPLKPKDSIKISKSYFDTDTLPDISKGIVLSVDGWMLAITTWTDTKIDKKTTTAVEYTYADKNVKLVINVQQNTIQLDVKSLDLYRMITPEDGIDVAIMVSATNQKYSANVVMDEKTDWYYSAPKELVATPKISKFKASHSASSKPGDLNKDSVSIGGDGLVKPDGFDKTTIPTVKIDAAEWIISVTDVKNDADKYAYSSPKTSTSKYNLLLDFTTGKKWSFKSSKDNNASGLNRNGTIVVTLVYGALGDQSVRLEGTDADGKPLVVIKSKLSYKR